MIPLVLVAGFLGSGKTTLLRHWAAGCSSLKIAFLVNEFASRDVDAELLRNDAETVVSLAGGSIFCKCLAADFIRTLSDLATGDWDAVVAEASGMADPRVVATLLHETALDQSFTLAEVVAVVDPATFPKLLHTLPAVKAQVQAADRVLINKADLHSEEEIHQIQIAVKDLAPNARVVAANHAQMPLELAGKSGSGLYQGALAEVPDPDFARFEVRLLAPLALDDLARLAMPLGESLFRVKGFAEVGGAVRLVEYAGGRGSVGPVQAKALAALVIIGASDKANELRRFGVALLNLQSGS